jgi:hypothetical protein
MLEKNRARAKDFKDTFWPEDGKSHAGVVNRVSVTRERIRQLKQKRLAT